MVKKRIVFLALAGLLVTSAGCGIRKNSDVKSDEYTLEIESINAGYGIKWLEELEKKFEASHDGIDVVVVPSRNFDIAESVLKSGPKNNTADILIYQYPYYMSLVNQTLSNGSPVLADLTDVYNSVAAGETASVKDRIDPSLENVFNYNGTDKYYAFPTMNDTNGIVYNAKMFEENEWEVPVTTSELLELADTILDEGEGVKPFAWFPGYWEYCTSVWWAQYEGLEAYESFYRPDYNVAPNDENSGYNQNGREESLRVLEDIVLYDSGYSIPGCLSLEFSEVQAAFVRQEKAAMMPNGGWLITEMKDASYGDKFSFMKVPVISALGQKLGVSESKLREIIKFIDGGETGDTRAVSSTKGFTPEEVISAIREARYLNSSSISYTNVALVPAYSDALPLAKEFLLYLTTTEAMQITFEYSGMMPLVKSEIDKLDESKMNRFNKSKVDLVKSANGRTVSMEICSDPIFYMNGLRAYTFIDNVIPEKTLGAQSAKDRKTASKIIQEEKDYIAASWAYYRNIAEGELNK